MPMPSRALLGLLLLGCGGVQMPEPLPEEEHTSPPAAPVFLGLPLTASPDAIAAAAPALIAQETQERGTLAADGLHEAHDVTLQTHLVFREGQLSSISAHSTPITVAAFDAFAREVQNVLGAGVSMECGSDEGASFDAYILTGRGSRHLHWEDETMRAYISLTPLSDGRLQLSASATWLPLLPPMPDDLARGAEDTPARAAKEDSTCEEANGGDEFGFAGVFFGASRVQAQVTHPGGELQAGHLTVDVEYGGVPGTATLMFYDDCLATVVFVADEPTESHYRALVAHIEGMAGESRRERCSPDGGAVDEEMVSAGRGSFQADWQHDTLSPRVSLTSLEAGTRRLVAEVAYSPLRGRAPRIDF